MSKFEQSIEQSILNDIGVIIGCECEEDKNEKIKRLMSENEAFKALYQKEKEKNEILEKQCKQLSTQNFKLISAIGKNDA